MTHSTRYTAVNRFASLAAACLIFALMARVATAAPLLIGVNFEGGGNGVSTPSTMASGDSAGVIPQTNWNNFAGSGGTSGLLINNLGSTTTTTVTVSNAGGTYSVSNGTPAPVGGDQELNQGFIYSNNTTPINTTISGIPFAHYDLYIYELNDNTNRMDATTLGSTTYYGTPPSPNDANHVSGVANTYQYIQTLSTNSSSPTPNADYVLFSNLSGASQTFTVVDGGNGYVNGFQIVAVTPEPSSFVLCGLGAAGLLWAARRRRRA